MQGKLQIRAVKFRPELPCPLILIKIFKRFVSNDDAGRKKIHRSPRGPSLARRLAAAHGSAAAGAMVNFYFPLLTHARDLIVPPPIRHSLPPPRGRTGGWTGAHTGSIHRQRGIILIQTSFVDGWLCVFVINCSNKKCTQCYYVHCKCNWSCKENG